MRRSSRCARCRRRIHGLLHHRLLLLSLTSSTNSSTSISRNNSWQRWLDEQCCPASLNSNKNRHHHHHHHLRCCCCCCLLRSAAAAAAAWDLDDVNYCHYWSAVTSPAAAAGRHRSVTHEGRAAHWRGLFICWLVFLLLFLLFLLPFVFVDGGSFFVRRSNGSNEGGGCCISRDAQTDHQLRASSDPRTALLPMKTNKEWMNSACLNSNQFTSH